MSARSKVRPAAVHSCGGVDGGGSCEPATSKAAAHESCADGHFEATEILGSDIAGYAPPMQRLGLDPKLALKMALGRQRREGGNLSCLPPDVLPPHG